jgi:hypothetical protein
LLQLPFLNEVVTNILLDKLAIDKIEETAPSSVRNLGHLVKVDAGIDSGRGIWVIERIITELSAVN